MLVSDIPIEHTPLQEIAARLCSAHDGALTIRAIGAGEQVEMRKDTPTLIWELDASRIRIGPLLGPQSEGCTRCQTFWIHHNRPDPQLWRTLPAAQARPAALFPWLPVHYCLLERVSSAYLRRGGQRTFVDIDAATLLVDHHRYLPAPDCPDCTPRPDDHGLLARISLHQTPKRSPGHFRTRSLTNALENLRSTYVDYRTGLVRHVYRDSTSTALPMWGAETSASGHSIAEVGYGRNPRSQRAQMVAILEAVERFCSQAPRSRRPCVRASYDQLIAAGMPAVDPRAFILCDSEQFSEPDFGLVPYSPTLVHDWIWAFSLKTHQPVLVPMQFAFYDGRLTPPSERFVLETSNGCAVGGSAVEAAFHGLLEVIERDAYMTRWHTHGRPRRLRLNDADMPEVRDLHARMAADGYELHAFAINLEVQVPTVLAMVVDTRVAAPVASYCASGAHPRAEDAILGALVEVCSSIGVYQRQFGNERERARAMYDDASLVRQMRDHVVLYSLPEALGRLAFLDRTQEPASARDLFASMERRWQGADLTAELQMLVNQALNVASDVIVVDQSSNVLQPLDLHCVKVLAPGMHPVTFGHQYRRVSPSRLEAACRFQDSLGEGSVRSISPHPHNFP